MTMKLTPHQLFSVLGKNYEPGAYGPDSFDCWGLVWFVYSNFFGIELPKYQGFHDSVKKRARVINGAIESKTWITSDEFEEGNIIVFGRRGINEHVGMMVKRNKVLHVSSKDVYVCVSSIKNFETIYSSMRQLKYAG